MRALAERDRLTRFMRAFGEAAREETRVYFTGGASAILLGWRQATIDVDIVFDPERDELFRAIASLKEQLNINVELASPAHFIPAVPGWEQRSVFIAREGRASYYHYDFYSQALSKIERGHDQDVADVHSMMTSGLVIRERLIELFSAIEPELYRYPALNATHFRAAVDAVVANGAN
jgi:hypothetical protein